MLPSDGKEYTHDELEKLAGLLESERNAEQFSSLADRFNSSEKQDKHKKSNKKGKSSKVAPLVAAINEVQAQNELDQNSKKKGKKQ